MNYIERPYFLYFLIPLAIYLILFWYFKFYENRQIMQVGNLNAEQSTSKKWKSFFPFLKFIPIVLVIFALSGPGYRSELLPDFKKGIDIMIAIDVSGSMAQSKDFLPGNRLSVSKHLIQNFIGKRKTDRLGLVVFAGAAYLQSPLTGDRRSLIEIVGDITGKTIREPGTAIGDAIILSTYRLKSSQAKSKVMILITDGVSNTGKLDPLTAMQVAKHYGIKIYAIGIGKSAGNPYQVDFEFLKKIAGQTGGLFYRATNAEKFETVLNSIDALERDTVKTKPKIIIESKYRLFLYPAILIWILDLLLRAFYVRYYI